MTNYLYESVNSYIIIAYGENLSIKLNHIQFINCFRLFFNKKIIKIKDSNNSILC
jgi:hypothetical protein